MELFQIKQILVCLNLDQDQFYKQPSYVKYIVSSRQRGGLFTKACFH